MNTPPAPGRDSARAWAAAAAVAEAEYRLAVAVGASPADRSLWGRLASDYRLAARSAALAAAPVVQGSLFG
jgi:hypothetical protein